MDINNRSTTPKVKSAEEAYLKLTLMSFQYHHTFTSGQKKMFEFMIADCTLGKIILAGDIKMKRIGSFDSYREYFIYQIDGRMLEFLHKSDINNLLNQTKMIVMKGFAAYKHLTN